MTDAPAAPAILTELAQARVTAHLRPGDLAIDATAGNGHDTAFLAHGVGDVGQVYSIDIQKAALNSTNERITGQSLAHRVTLIHGDHAELRSLIPSFAHNKVRAVVFNLGYLPGGDKSRTTRSGTTLNALEQALSALGPGGCLSVIAYTGHPGGKHECEQIKQWADSLDRSDYSVEVEIPRSAVSPPEWIFIQSIGIEATRS